MDFTFATPASAGAAPDFGTASGTDNTAGTDNTVLSSTETPRAGVVARHIVFEHDGVSTVARPQQAAAGHPPAAQRAFPLGACPPALPAGRGGGAAQGVPCLFIIKSHAALGALHAALVAQKKGHRLVLCRFPVAAPGRIRRPCGPRDATFASVEPVSFAR